MALNRGWLSRLGIPPARLRPVPDRWRLPVRFFWALLLLWVFAAQFFGIGAVVHTARVTKPALFAVGIDDTGYRDDGGDTVFFDPQTDVLLKQGFTENSRILSVAGKPVPVSARSRDVAALIAAAPAPVRLTIEDEHGVRKRVTLTRDPTQAKDSELPPALQLTISQGATGLLALVLTLTSILLFRRQPFDPVSLLLSTAFLFGAASLGPATYFYSDLHAPWLFDVFATIWAMMTLATLPAFPDGQFKPRWSGWLFVLAPPMAVLLNFDAYDLIVMPLFIVYLGLAVWMPIRRYRRTPPGLERQQLKWAAFGFVSAGTLLSLGLMIFLVVFSTDQEGLASALAALGGLVLIMLSLLLLPLGILVSLLRFRLWDADTAIGRSLGYAGITLVIGGVWAASMATLNDLLAQSLGTNKPMVAAISAVLAALVLGPARERVNDWVETRFQSGVVALRKLPERIQLWQHDDHPHDLGERVVAAITEGLHASRVAVLIYLESGYRVVGSASVEAAEIDRWMADHAATGALHVDNLSRSDPVFPLRITLDDEGAPIGVLLLGPRSDGSVYSKDERGALEAVENPLASAFRQAQLRRRRDLRTRELIDSLEQRLAALETLKPKTAS